MKTHTHQPFNFFKCSNRVSVCGVAIRFGFIRFCSKYFCLLLRSFTHLFWQTSICAGDEKQRMSACTKWISMFEYHIIIHRCAEWIITIGFINGFNLCRFIHNIEQPLLSLCVSTCMLVTERTIILCYSAIGMFRTHFTVQVLISHFNDQSYQQHSFIRNVDAQYAYTHKMWTNRHEFTIQRTQTHTHRRM